MHALKKQPPPLPRGDRTMAALLDAPEQEKGISHLQIADSDKEGILNPAQKCEDSA